MSGRVLRPIDPAAYQKRLAVLVPFRDRHAHLRQLIPHLINYFTHDKLDRAIDWRVHVVEQVSGGLFNKGRLLNAGYSVIRGTADYLCIHDVDYLPVWADYSFTPHPTRLIWHGLRPGEDYHQFFGAVVALSCADFEAINGLANGYTGWGMEDNDMLTRCRYSALTVGSRDGYFIPLVHPTASLDVAGKEPPEVTRNRETYQSRSADFGRWLREDGLSSASFEHLDSAPLVLDGKSDPRVMHHRISFP